MENEIIDQQEPEISDKQREKQLKKEYKKLHKERHPFMGKVKVALACLLVGAVVGVAGALYVQSNAPAKDGPTPTIIFDRVMKQNELVVASQRYTEIEKVVDKNSLFGLVDIPFTENSFWYRYVGTIKVAVDLSKAQLVGQNGNKITISLPNPYISSNTPDMSESTVLEEQNNIINPIHVSDVDAYQKRCVEKVEAAAQEGDLFEEAKKNAAEDLSELFSVSLGQKYEVVIEWR